MNSCQLYKWRPVRPWRSIILGIIFGFLCDGLKGYKISSRNHVLYTAEEPILVGPDQIYNGRMYYDGKPLVGTASNIVFDGDVYLTTDSEVVNSNILREHHPVLHLFSPSEAVRKEVTFFGPKKVIRMNMKKARRTQKYKNLMEKPKMLAQASSQNNWIIYHLVAQQPEEEVNGF